MKPMRVDVDLVLVPVTVVDSKERPVLGLEKQNFTVYEGNQPQQIQFFSAEDSPISVGLILDLSKSMSNKLVTERAAVEAFFNNANAKDDYFVIAFSDRPRVLATSTQSIDDIQQKLAAANPDGHTALLDAVYLAVAKMRSSRYQRRALFIISDGGDNHSRYTEGEIKSLVKEADVLMYAIGIYDHYFPTEEERLGPTLLSDITELTGGRAFTIDNPNAIATCGCGSSFRTPSTTTAFWCAGSAWAGRRRGSLRCITRICSRRPTPHCSKNQRRLTSRGCKFR